MNTLEFFWVIKTPQQERFNTNKHNQGYLWKKNKVDMYEV